MIRIGAVNYLNSKPLVYGLEQSAPDARVFYDLPSRLADSLAAGRLDVALVPSVELFGRSDYTIVSDACVASRGPVLSVKLLFRVPPAEVGRVALDEGSRTSAALARILLRERCDASPQWEVLPIGSGVEQSAADAVLLIGDRAIQSTGGRFAAVWDLGYEWSQWTGLPFVFAMWVARPGVDRERIASELTRARDEGTGHLDEIARREAASLGISESLASSYLRDNLYFTLAQREQQGLLRFCQACIAADLAPPSSLELLQASIDDGLRTHESRIA